MRELAYVVGADLHDAGFPGPSHHAEVEDVSEHLGKQAQDVDLKPSGQLVLGSQPGREGDDHPAGLEIDIADDVG